MTNFTHPTTFSVIDHIPSVINELEDMLFFGVMSLGHNVNVLNA